MHSRAASLALLFAGAFAASAAPQDAPAARRGESREAALPSYGTTQSSFYRMGASEFSPLDAERDIYSDLGDGNALEAFGRYGTVGASIFVGIPHLPSGARVLGVYVTGCAGEVGGLFGFVKSCTYFGTACQNLTLYNGTEGCGNDFLDLASSNYVVDNGPTGGRLLVVLANLHGDGSDTIAGATIEYVLQVSPAPATATFNDVPPADTGFQYIEALVASGITGGTGGGNYSPDAFVTRRQMAIFIAKALGLHWR